MARRRLNKNLVAFLTGSGIVLAVIVVAIAAYNASRRDPAAIAEKAAAQEALDDLERAGELYKKAFSVRQEAKYLVEAARCARKMGEIPEMFGLLRAAHAQSPSDAQVLEALLTRYRELYAFFIYKPWDEILDYAERLLEQEPDHLLALVWQSEALEHMKQEDAGYASEADEVLNRATEIDPTDAFVALVWADRITLRAMEPARELYRRGQQARANQLWEENKGQAAARRIEILRPAVAAHPDDVRLRIVLAQTLMETDQVPACRELLEEGLATHPDDADLRLEMASCVLQELQRKLSSDDQTDVPALVREGLQHVEKAIEAEPALYPAYSLRAQLWRLGWVTDGTWETELRARQREIMESFAAALERTVGLRTFRAALGARDRLQMVREAFEFGLSFYRTAADEPIRAQALTYLRRFLQEAKTQYPEHPLTALLEGHVALVDGDSRLAVKAFREAETTEQDNISRAAKEQLIQIYQRQGELGLALQYIRDLLISYDEQGQTVPPSLYLDQADILLRLERNQEALDLLDSVATKEPFRKIPRLRAALSSTRARVLAALGRGEEAQRVIEATESDDPAILFDKARIAASNEDYDTAIKLANRVLEAYPENVSTIRLVIHSLVAAERSEEAIRFVQERMARTTDTELRRLLAAYEVGLSSSDEEERARKIEELIAAIPDEFERESEYYRMYLKQGDLEQALVHLSRMEELRPDDTDVLWRQFDMSLRQQDCERTAQYAGRLSELNADQVGGAMFRGQYELSCGDAERALSEFRAAERTFPNDSKLKISIAQALLNLEPPRFDDAIQMLELAVDFDPRNFLAHKWLYHCYGLLGRPDQGIPHLEAAAELNPDDEFVKANTQLLEEERDPQKGIERREALRAENPQDVPNLMRLVILYERVKDVEHARERLEAAAEAEPTSLPVARYAANFFARQRQREAGEQFLKKHLEVQEGLPKIVAQALLGRFYEMLGDQARLHGESENADQCDRLALQIHQQAQEQVAELLPAGSEDRRRGMIMTASELAQYYRRANRTEEMIDAYRVVLSYLQPEQTASIQLARRYIIHGLMSLRRHGDASQEVADYRRLFPNDPVGMKAEAELLIVSRKPDEAREVLTRILEVVPDDPWSRYARGRIYIAQRRYVDAREDLLRLKNLPPPQFNLNYVLELVRLYEITEDYELAEAELRALLPLPRVSRDVELRLLRLLRNTDQFEKAQEFVNEMMANDPKQWFWPYQLGKLLVAREEHSAAARFLQDALVLIGGKDLSTPVFEKDNLLPFYQVVLTDWLLALVRAGRADQATRVYEQLNPAVLAPRVQTRAAEAYLEQQQREVAVALLEQAVSAASMVSVGETRFVVGNAVELLEREEGLAILRRVLEHAENPGAGLRLRSTLARYQVISDDPAENAEGVETTKAVIEMAPEGSPLHIEGLLVHALGLDRSGQREQALQTYERVLSLVPDNVRALNNLAYLLADAMNRPAEALPYAERLRDVAPDNPTVLDTVGWVYFKNGNRDQAEAAFIEATRIDADNLAARYHLGQLYADSGQQAAARRAFRRLLERAREKEDDDYIKKAEESLAELD